MRLGLFVFMLLLPFGLSACSHTSPGTTGLLTYAIRRPEPHNSPIKVAEKVDFATQIRPILEAKCQNCHFKGGTMYQRLPFDRPETIKALGTKLFTRIKDENERRLIRTFLEQK